MSLTLQSIETFSNVQLYNAGRELNIMASNVWELKQKLIIEVMRRKGDIVDLSWYSEQVRQEKEATLKEDAKRRQILEKYLYETKIIYDLIKKFDKIKEPTKGNQIEKRDDPLISFINNTIPMIDEEFEKMSEMVKNKPKSSLIICGDSGAGKSSFINLLIGETILPTSIRSNSSCQVRITYGEVECAEIMDNDSKIHIIEKSNFATDLRKFLENIDDRGVVSCKSATIYLKSSVLEGGLDIFDTIGLGETEMFNNELKKNLNQITGIIFLLKKNNPIGDQTIGGLYEIIHQLVFNGVPGGSMNFIINMCDQLQTAMEREELRKNVFEQLQDKCSLFNPEITTFSTKQELDFQSNNVMTTSYQDIMKLIQQLHINCINTNTVKVFRFLYKFVSQTINRISEFEKYSGSAKMERRDHIQKLRNFEKQRKANNDSYHEENKKSLLEEKKACKKLVMAYFYMEETKMSVVEAVVNKQENLLGMSLIKDIDKEIENIVREEIVQHFKKFIENENVLRNCCNKMLASFIVQFSEHQQRKDTILLGMNTHIDYTLNFLEKDLSKIKFENMKLQPDQNMSFLKLISPILVPIIKLQELMQVGLDAWCSLVASIVVNKNVQAFYSNTEKYVKQQATVKYSKYIGKSDNINGLIHYLFLALEQVTEDFSRFISDEMDHLAKNIDSLEDDMRNKARVLGTYKDIKGMLLKICEQLGEFGLLRLHRDKLQIMWNNILVTGDNVDFSLTSVFKSKEANTIIKCRNHFISRGHGLSKEGGEYCILVYKNKDGKTWRDAYQECKIRIKSSAIIHNSKHQDVKACLLEVRRQVIFSMENETALRPTFIVNKIDCTLSDHMDETRRNIEFRGINGQQTMFTEICRLLSQILTGLMYLHSNHLVHYDLTGHSIAYSLSARSAILTSISLPTRVIVKYDKESTDYVLKMSHLPVDVIDPSSDSLYTDKSDMYCLGILIYTMWMGIHPFYDFITSENVLTLSNFVNTLKTRDHDSIILTKTLKKGFAHLVYTWSFQCREGCLSAKELMGYLEKPTYYGSI